MLSKPSQVGLRLCWSRCGVKISTDLMITVDLRRASGTCCPGTRPGAVSRSDQAGRWRRARRHPGVERR